MHFSPGLMPISENSAFGAMHLARSNILIDGIFLTKISEPHLSKAKITV